MTVSCVASQAHADIDPPAGLDWLKDHQFILENAADYPDFVFVSWPCTAVVGAPFSLTDTGYCILQTKDGKPREVDRNATLFAVRSGKVKFAWDPLASNHGAWLFTEPKITPGKEASFFETDPRVVRPGYKFSAPWGSTVPKGVGLREATYFVHIDSVDEKGVTAHFSRAVYRCRNGKEVEVPGTTDWSEPAVPSCPPATDDPPLALPPEESTAAPPPPPPLGSTLWLGALVAGASLLLGGVLLRSEVKARRAG